MPSDWIYTVGNAGALPLAEFALRFEAIAGRIGGTDASAQEERRQVRARAAYTWQNIGARVAQNSVIDVTRIRPRINGLNQFAIELLIGGGLTGWFENTTGTASVVDGDLLSYATSIGAGHHGDTLTLTAISSQLQHASLERPIAVTSTDGQSAVGESLTLFFSIIGDLGSGESAESDTEYTLRQGVTFTNMRCFVQVNNTDNASTFDFREDGISSTNLSISIGANTTGDFEDTGSEPVSTGSTVNYRVVAGAGIGGDSITFTIMHMLQAGAVVGRNMGVAGVSTKSPGTTDQHTLEGPFNTAVELNTQIEAAVAVDVTDMFVLVTANSLTTAATTIVLRLNGADSTLSISIAAGASGIFEASDTVSIAVDDLLNWQLSVAAGGSGTIQTVIIGLEQGQAGVGEGPEVIHFRSLTAFGRP